MALDFAKLKGFPTKPVAYLKGLLAAEGEQSSSGWRRNIRGMLGSLLLAFSVALLSLLISLFQMTSDTSFATAAGNVQVVVQQAARDAVLATHSDEAAAVRLRNETDGVDSDINLMRNHESNTFLREDEIAPLLDKLDKSWKSLYSNLKNVHEAMPEEAQSVAKLNSIVSASDEIIATVGKAVDKYHHAQGTAQLWLLIAAAVGMTALVLLVSVVYRQTINARQRFLAVEQANFNNQEAILHLLDEMGDLADGDLTVKAQVTENITGAIADSINYTIDSLRDLVTEINRATGQVNQATAQAQATSADLLGAAEQQSRQIVETGEAVTNMTHSILQVSSNAGEASQVAQRSLQAATQGAQAVQNTISGMNEIRTQIQETSKRIKRLGESSQEISEIVELISDITEQTNILALNAAIQAASAGEAGRGFTVVAEEVQRLAERSSEATKQISAIVKTIQTDTNGAVAAMEKSTEGVVEGARLSDAAGQALNEIETVTNNLAHLIQTISTATVAQTEVAATVSRNMQQIQNITSQTTEGTKQTALSVGQLTSLAENLSDSVAGFKLS